MKKQLRHSKKTPSLGIIGVGAFGRLMAKHLAPHMPLRLYDPHHQGQCCQDSDLGTFVSLGDAAACDLVVLSVPVSKLREVVASIAPHLQEGAIVIDVGSVKSLPAQIMEEGLPTHVEIVGTHPLFGPQSAREGVAGLKIAVCPIRGRRWRSIAAFCSKQLGLDVIVTTSEEHDREAAMVQGLTHLIAKVLVRMEPLPKTMTTRSFELLMQGVEMVRHDAPEVFDAIERLNPFVPLVRRTFFDLAAALDREIGSSEDASGIPMLEP